MESISKSAEIFRKSEELRLLETENLINSLIRYNDNLMDQSGNEYVFSKDNDNFNDSEKRARLQGFAGDVQQQTFEISTILEIIKKNFEQMQDFLNEDLHCLKTENSYY